VLIWSSLCIPQTNQINMFKKQEDLALAEAVNETLYINVANGAYLNSTLPCLPNGIIDKTYTGIGGTSLELDCERDSLVVVPYNNIADAKASKLSVSRKYLTHKYRKAYNDRPNRRLEKYLLSTKRSGQYIKIICVNDQLVNLKQELNAAGKSFEDFFILFDEIDSMQEQSSFRSVMDNCMDVYLGHPSDKRAMITATLRGFTHPELQNEPRYKVVSEGRPKDKIDVIVTTSGKEELLLQIMDKMALDEKKVVVACNHIRTALEITWTLEKNLPTLSVGILCSPGSKKAVGELYQTLDEHGKLPCKVNIITAAFFNGCDVMETYHNIMFSSISISSLQLSPSTIYQISGRGRNGLESNVLVIQQGERHDDYTYYSEDELVSLGKQNARIDNGLKEMTSELGNFGVGMLKALHGVLVEGFKNFPAVYRKVDEFTSEISYFKIDQRIMEQRTCFLMENTPSYIEAIEEIFEVQLKGNLLSNQSIEFEGIDKKQSLIKILENFRELFAVSEFVISKKELLKFKSDYKSLRLKEFDIIMNSFELALNNSWNMGELLNRINDCVKAHKIQAQLKKLYCYLLWCSFNGDSKLNNLLTRDINVSELYTAEVLKQKERDTIERLENYKSFVAVRYHEFRALLKSTPSLIRNILFICKESKKRVDGRDTRVFQLTALRSQLDPFMQV
jgi:hypothetical protein